MADWSLLASTFSDGDILYGLDEGRKEARKAILNLESKTKIKVQFMCCLVRSKKVDRIIIQNTLTDSVFDALKVVDKLKTGGKLFESDKQIQKNPGVKADPDRAVGFKNHLQGHEKWNLEKGISDQDVKGKGWQANKPKDAQVNDMDRARKAWTRTSKAGLEYQTKVRKGAVHFILDGLQYDRVLKKIPGDVTSAEIRWLYRHRSDKEVMDHVNFWFEGAIKDPPWDWPENRAAFAKYHPSSEKDIKSDHTDSVALREVIESSKVRSLIAQWENRK